MPDLSLDPVALSWSPSFLITREEHLQSLIYKHLEETGFPVAQLVKNLPAMQETRV